MNWKLIRAWACYWIVQAIALAASPFPRSQTKAGIVNALTRPFFSYAAYWALRSNPKIGRKVRDLEARRDKAPRP